MTTTIERMGVEDFLKLNASTESYWKYWRWRKDVEGEPENAWMADARTIAAAEKDLKLFGDRLEAFESREGAKVGEWIQGYDGKLTRFTHAWNDGIQTGGGQGSFYLNSASLSYSGGLDSAIPYDLIELTDERKLGQCWLFHHGSSGGGRGVYYNHPFRVWKTRVIDRIDWVKRLPYQYRVVEVTEKVYDYALEVVPPVAQSKYFFAMGEADSHKLVQNRPVSVYYCFVQINGRFFCYIDTIEEAKTMFSELTTKLTTQN